MSSKEVNVLFLNVLTVSKISLRPLPVRPNFALIAARPAGCVMFPPLHLVSADGCTHIALSDAGAERACGRRDVGPGAATVSRVQCVLTPSADSTAVDVLSQGTNQTGVRAAAGAEWRWLRRGELSAGAVAGWQVALDRALPANALFTFRAGAASQSGEPTVAMADRPRWSWAAASGWCSYSDELSARLESAWAAGAAHLALASGGRIAKPLLGLGLPDCSRRRARGGRGRRNSLEAVARICFSPPLSSRSPRATDAEQGDFRGLIRWGTRPHPAEAQAYSPLSAGD